VYGNLIRVGVQQKVSAVNFGAQDGFRIQRYNIVDERDIMDAGQKLNESKNLMLCLKSRLGRVRA